MENNYWADIGTGVYDEALKISIAIWDYNDDPNQKVIIDFEPFSTESVPVEQAPLGSIKAMFR
jgi:hypothetical protein